MPKIDLLKFIQLKPLSALATFPPGLGKQALSEMESILSDPMIPEKKNTSSPKMILFPEKILIRNCSIQSLLGICFRSFFLRDIYLLLEDISNTDLKEKLPDAILDWLVESKNYSLQVQIRKNPKIDPEALADDWKQSINSLFTSSDIPINTQELNAKKQDLDAGILKNSTKLSKDFNQDQQIQSPRFFISTLRNKSSFYLALRNQPLYRRGFRTEFSLSAPLSEDLASVLIDTLVRKFSFGEKEVSLDAYIPFSGTGTFAFELFMQIFSIVPGILRNQEDEYSKRMNQSKIWKFLLEKSGKLFQSKLNNSLPQVVIHNYDFRSDIVDNSIQNWKQFLINVNQNLGIEIEAMIPQIKDEITWNSEDFFETKIPKPKSPNLIIPLNPPFGIRHKNSEPISSFYKRIAQKINLECAPLFENTKIQGFLLCPDAASYSNATEIWQKDWDLETLHFSQGKLSIRALFFSSKY